MSTLDRILHILGAVATGVVVTGASGGVAVPAWLMITASVVTFATGTATGPMLKKGPQTGVGAGAKGQAVDAENPK